MDIQDLQPGDVLLFSGEKGSYISEAIMWLTGAPVSHAAMAYSPSTQLIEETPPAVRVADDAERFVERTITVMRHTPPQSSYAPVLNAATGYLNDKAPYANANLYLVGILLLYRKFAPDTLLQRVIIKILKKLAASLITYFNEHKYPGKLPMVCSQFVFQCYEDAGSDYRLRIQGGVLGVAATAAAPNLLDQAIARVRSDSSQVFRELAESSGVALTAEEMPSDEALAEELLLALQAKPGIAAEAGAELDSELVLAIHDFAQALQTVRTGVVITGDELSQANALGMASNALAVLKSEEAYFVSPADLLLHCPDLSKAGVING